jgi:hypothetical protein
MPEGDITLARRGRETSARCFSLLLWLLLAATACPVLAQQVVGGIPSGQQVDRNGDRLPTEEQQEFNRHVLRGEGPPTPERPREPRLAEAQIKEDFRRLQIINNEVQASAARNGTPSQTLIKSLSEIRKRARRLRSNLVLAAGKGEESTVTAGGESLAALLTMMDESVKGFVTNPMFGSGKVLDVELTKKAAADLARVIELSGVIADRLRQGAR